MEPDTRTEEALTLKLLDKRATGGFEVGGEFHIETPPPLSCTVICCGLPSKRCNRAVGRRLKKGHKQKPTQAK